MQERSQRSLVTLLIGLAVPLALLGAAYAAWAISDRLVYVGPLDKAKFGWLVVVPLLVATPIATGLAWRSLATRPFMLAVIVVAVIVGTIAGILHGLTLVGNIQGCEFGTRLSGGEIGSAAALTGVATGGGFAASGAVAAALMREGRLGLGAFVGAMCGFVTFWAATLAGSMALGGVGICNRPPL